jgi:hypothetical protein
VSTWSDPGNSLAWPDSKPFALSFAGACATGNTFTISLPTYTNNLCVLLGIDVVVQGANPTQIDMGFGWPAATTYFYYDSQSTGEGNGVRFQWRGQLAFPGSTTITITAISVSGPGPNWSAIAWGLILPFARAI